MSEKRYFWLRLYDDFFTSKRIKKLRSIAGGDTYTIIYLKMQLKSLKTEGYLYFDSVMDDFAEELALDIDEKVDDVKVTIAFLLKVGLLETNDNSVYHLTYMDQLIGSESAATQRSRDFRNRKKEKEKLQCNDNPFQCNDNPFQCNEDVLQCNANATEVQLKCNAEIEKEIYKENIYKRKRNKFTDYKQSDTDLDELSKKIFAN